MSLSLVTAPELEPVSKDEANAHLHLTVSNEDDLVEALITAARERAEDVTKRALITQTWELKLDCFPSLIRLPKPPLQALNSIKYIDTAGVEQTLSSSLYVVDAPSGPKAEPARIALAYGAVWPSTQEIINAVRVEFDAGYGDEASDVPQSIRQAMLLMIGHWYANREAVITGTVATELPLSARAILASFDATMFGAAA